MNATPHPARHAPVATPSVAPSPAPVPAASPGRLPDLPASVITLPRAGSTCARVDLGTGAPQMGAPQLGPPPLGDAKASTLLPGPSSEQAVGVDLVGRVQTGDLEAFGVLYDRYFPQIFRFVSTRVASRQLAEDLTSETFLRALRRIASFTWQGRDVAAWLVTIARNLITDHYKSSRTRLELTTDDIAGSGPALLEEGPEHEVLDAISHRALLEAVTLLGEEQRRCIELRFLQGMTIAETARELERGEAAVRALQYRAVRTLARLLPEAAVR